MASTLRIRNCLSLASSNTWKRILSAVQTTDVAADKPSVRPQVSRLPAALRDKWGAMNLNRLFCADRWIHVYLVSSK